MGSISHHITPLVINSLGSRHTRKQTHTHTYRHLRTYPILRNLTGFGWVRYVLANSVFYAIPFSMCIELVVLNNFCCIATSCNYKLCSYVSALEQKALQKALKQGSSGLAKLPIYFLWSIILIYCSTSMPTRCYLSTYVATYIQRNS